MSEKPKADAPRTARQEETQTRRRRRDDMGPGGNLKLHVPEQSKDANFHYRWIKANPGRVQQKTKMDDFDVVSDQAIASVSEGTNVERISSRDGERMILVKKPLKYHEEDKAKAAAAINATEEAMRRAAPPSAEGLSGSEAYVPGGRNIVNGR